VKFSADVFNIKLVANLLNQLLFKFGKFWLSRFSLVMKILALYPLKHSQNREAVEDVDKRMEDVVVEAEDVVSWKCSRGVGDVVEVVGDAI
jgi:hypothetical protein